MLGNDVYGGTHRLINRVHGAWGVAQHDRRPRRPGRGARGARAPTRTRILWIETPSNPLMKISDIAALAELGHAAGALVVVDNTFASPALQQPLALGADVVVHSTTKYLGGHSDVIGGALVIDDDELAEKVGFIQFAAGAVSSPMDAWLTVRGIKTLAVRMDRHSANAQAIAEALVGHPAIEAVYYPGLPTHPGHELAARQMSGFGGMLSVALAGGAAAARRFAESTDGVPAGGVARRRRVADRLPVGDDARLGARDRARGAGQRHPAVRRHRGCRPTCSPTSRRRSPAERRYGAGVKRLKALIATPQGRGM